ncbi:type IX secretion system plug protein [Flavobacterium sp.]|uniref:type IX secretion system plug protein n=1 Tax=Flavobacterium sp. TaxID=239 RepID=UPI0040474470
MNTRFYILAFLISFSNSYTQVENEIPAPFNIKTISFVQNNNNVLPFFKLGDTFELQFDDLFGNEADYYYTITQCNYDWTPSNLAKVEYLNGMDNQRIITYENSFNTLQLYSHYRQQFPNKFNRITKTGNYVVKVFNDEQEIVFSKRFILYNESVSVLSEVRRARDFESLNQKQNIELTIKYGELSLQNPVQNVKISIFQNGNWNNVITNIKPQYTIGTELIYRYNKETQFWAGNEFYTLDNSQIRVTNNSVGRVTSGDIYNSHLYTNNARKNNIYTYFPDFNGNFVVLNYGSENSQIEADYSWVYFTLSAPDFFDKEEIFVTGMFNNYAMNEENKMVYNKESGLYEKAILIKQGYTNYQYTIKSKNNTINAKDAIDGNFYQTENNYTILVYYKGNNDRNDSVIGISNTNSEGIRN